MPDQKPDQKNDQTDRNRQRDQRQQHQQAIHDHCPFDAPRTGRCGDPIRAAQKRKAGIAGPSRHDFRALPHTAFADEMAGMALRIGIVGAGWP